MADPAIQRRRAAVNAPPHPAASARAERADRLHISERGLDFTAIPHSSSLAHVVGLL